VREEGGMMTRQVVCGFAILVLLGQSPGAAETTEKTVLKKKGAEPEVVDSVRYDRISMVFRITKGNATFALPETSVEYCRPPKPDGFDKIADVAGLESMVAKCHRLWWDVEAFKKLMPLLVKNGEAAKAIRLYKDMVPILGPSMPLALQREYWNALAKNREDVALQKELTDTITGGGREASAWAYLMRGDVLAAQGKRAEALVEGYLKTVLMFDDIASCRKVALERTVAVMEELGDQRVEKFRKMQKGEATK
jgi:hypothetical protein